MKLLKKKTVKLKNAKAKIKQELGKLKIDHTKQHEENRYLKLEILKKKGREKYML